MFQLLAFDIFTAVSATFLLHYSLLYRCNDIQLNDTRHNNVQYDEVNGIARIKNLKQTLEYQTFLGDGANNYQIVTH
jgi:hypothetical protein